MTQTIDGAVDRGGRERPQPWTPADHARLAQVGDHVFDVRRSDVRERPVAEARKKRRDLGLVLAGNRQIVRDDVTFTVERHRFPKRDGPSLEGIEAARVERARANSQAQLVECRAGLRLRANLAVGPLRQADAHATKAAHQGCSQRWRLRPVCSQSL